MRISLQTVTKIAVYAAVATIPFVAAGIGARQPDWYVCGRIFSPEPVTYACLGERPASAPAGVDEGQGRIAPMGRLIVLTSG